VHEREPETALDGRSFNGRGGIRDAMRESHMMQCSERAVGQIIRRFAAHPRPHADAAAVAAAAEAGDGE